MSDGNGKADLELVRYAGQQLGAELSEYVRPLYENDVALHEGQRQHTAIAKMIADRLADLEQRLARLEGGSQSSSPIVNLHLHDGAKRVVRDENGVIVGTEPADGPDAA
jgi:hypothetical protein